MIFLFVILEKKEQAGMVARDTQQRVVFFFGGEEG